MLHSRFVQMGIRFLALPLSLSFPAMMAARASTPGAPSFSVKAGNYTTAFTVKISDTSSCARMHYTTNGSTPTKSSAAYSSPISISKTTTLKAIAACSYGSASAVTSATYTLAAKKTSTSSSSSTATSGSSFFGMDVNGLTYGTPWPQVPVGTLRLWDSRTSWWDLEGAGRGTYNWSTLDEQIALAQENGAQIILTFGRTPQWAISGTCTGSYVPQGCAEPPAQLSDWDAYVTALINHVGPGVIKYWELWNEANLTLTWTGTNAQLVAMAADARKIIKAVDPNAVILSPSNTVDYTTITCTVSNNCGSAWLQSWLAAGGAATVDGVAFHPYPQMTTAPEQVVKQVATQRAVMSANGIGSLPLLDTESSWGENSDLPSAADQEAFLARHLLLEQSSGVAVSTWYAYDNSEWGPLWSKNSGLNEAGEAYGQVAEWLTGATLTSACAPLPSNAAIYECKYSRSGGYSALAVWSTTGDTSISVPSGYTQYHDLAGNLKAISGSTVPIATVPILLENKSAF